MEQVGVWVVLYKIVEQKYKLNPSTGKADEGL